MSNHANVGNTLSDDFEDDLVITADVFADADMPPAVLQETKPVKTKSKSSKPVVLTEDKKSPDSTDSQQNRSAAVQEQSSEKKPGGSKPQPTEAKPVNDSSAADFPEKVFFRLNDINSRVNDITKLNGEFKKFIESFHLFTKEEKETREVLQAIFEQMNSISTEMTGVNKEFIALNRHLPAHIKEIKAQLGLTDNRPTLMKRFLDLIRSTEFRIYSLLCFLLILLAYSAYKVNILEERLNQFINSSAAQTQAVTPAKVIITDSDSAAGKKPQPKKQR